MKYSNTIIRNSKIMLDKPVIKGTRITVELILRKLSEGYNTSEILEMYPQLKQSQILAVLEYAADVLSKEVIIEV